MAKKPASLDQVGALMLKLTSIFLGFITGKNKKIEQIDGGKIQEIIDEENTDSILDVIIQLINNGWKMTIIVAQRVINFDAVAKLPFSKAKFYGRTGIGMVGTVAIDFKKIKAVNKLEKGESYITGNEFISRLKKAKEKLFGANLIDLLVNNQNDLDVKEFLNQYRGKVLVDFEDVFAGSNDYLYIRYAIVNDGVWVSYCRWLGDDFDEPFLALVVAKDA